jgi:pyrimidine operon attenuation protein/uracil phosphoribosyltransferase
MENNNFVAATGPIIYNNNYRMNIVQILTAQQVEQKLKRMAYEIWEKNSNEKEIMLIGIEEVGAVVADNLSSLLQQISPLKISRATLSMNKREPLQDEIKLSAEPRRNQTIVLVDDVANSGKTLLYAINPLLVYEPRKVQIAVLVDRKHKSFPVSPDIIGLSVSTTLQEHIIVNYDGQSLTGAHLE